MTDTWNTVSPDGTKSAKANVPFQQQNTTYITNKMPLDHYWNEDSSKNGYHKQVNMTVQSADPTSLPTGLDGMYYCRNKTAGEAPDVQSEEPYFYKKISSADHYLQLGMRAIVHFEVNQTTFTTTIKYSHNVASVKQDSTGKYLITFTNALPSKNYIVNGSAMRSSSTNESPLSVGIPSDTSKNTYISENSVMVSFSSTSSGSLRDPLVGMISIVGG